MKKVDANPISRSLRLEDPTKDLQVSSFPSRDFEETKNPSLCFHENVGPQGALKKGSRP